MKDKENKLEYADYLRTVSINISKYYHLGYVISYQDWLSEMKSNIRNEKINQIIN